MTDIKKTTINDLLKEFASRCGRLALEDKERDKPKGAMIEAWKEILSRFAKQEKIIELMAEKLSSYGFRDTEQNIQYFGGKADERVKRHDT